MTPVALTAPGVGATPVAGTNFATLSMIPAATVPTALPGFDAVARAGGMIYGVNTATNSLSVVDPSTGISRQFFVTNPTLNTLQDMRQPIGVTVSTDGSSVYVLSALTDHVTGFARNQATGDLTYVTSITVSPNSQQTLQATSILATSAVDLVVSGAGGSIGFSRIAYFLGGASAGFATRAPGDLGYAEDPATGLTISTYAGPTGVTSGAVSADGTSFYVASPGKITMLNRSTLATMSYLALPSTSAGHATAFTVDAVTGKIYVVDGTALTLSVGLPGVTGGTIAQTLVNGQGGVTGLAAATNIAITTDATGQYTYVLVSAPTSVSTFLADPDPAKGLVFE